MKEIPIVIGTLGTIPICLVRKLEDLEIGVRAETIQTTILLVSAIILTRVLETWENLLSLRLKRKTISKCWCEKLTRNRDTNGSPNLGQTTKPYNKQKKRGLQNCGLCCPDRPVSKIERTWKEITWTLLGNWKTIEHKSDGDTCNILRQEWDSVYIHVYLQSSSKRLVYLLKVWEERERT